MEAPTMLKLSARRSSLESQQGFPTRVAPSQFCQLPSQWQGSSSLSTFRKSKGSMMPGAAPTIQEAKWEGTPSPGTWYFWEY